MCSLIPLHTVALPLFLLAWHCTNIPIWSYFARSERSIPIEGDARKETQKSLNGRPLAWTLRKMISSVACEASLSSSEQAGYVPPVKEAVRTGHILPSMSNHCGRETFTYLRSRCSSSLVGSRWRRVKDDTNRVTCICKRSGTERRTHIEANTGLLPALRITVAVSFQMLLEERARADSQPPQCARVHEIVCCESPHFGAIPTEVPTPLPSRTTQVRPSPPAPAASVRAGAGAKLRRVCSEHRCRDTSPTTSR